VNYRDPGGLRGAVRSQSAATWANARRAGLLTGLLVTALGSALSSVAASGARDCSAALGPAGRRSPGPPVYRHALLAIGTSLRAAARLTSLLERGLAPVASRISRLDASLARLL
jgi:hypothetical protein